MTGGAEETYGERGSFSRWMRSLPNVCECNVQSAMETRVRLSMRTNRIHSLGTKMFNKINNVAGMHIQPNQIAEMK